MTSAPATTTYFFHTHKQNEKIKLIHTVYIHKLVPYYVDLLLLESIMVEAILAAM